LTGPELDNHPSKGTYEAVWVPIAKLRDLDVLPKAIANLVMVNNGVWDDALIEIDEATAQS
jgi:hypothetical protein